METHEQILNRKKTISERLFYNLEERLRKQILFWRLLVGFLLSTDAVSIVFYVLRAEDINVERTIIQIIVAGLLLGFYYVTYTIHHWDEEFSMKQSFEESKIHSITELIGNIFDFGMNMVETIADPDKQIEWLERLPRIINFISESELSKTLAMYQESFLEFVNIAKLQGDNNLRTSPTRTTHSIPQTPPQKIVEQKIDPKMEKALHVVEGITDTISEATSEDLNPTS